MALVTLDTQILIWGGIRGLSGDASDEPEKATRRQWLLEKIKRQKDKIIIPAIVAAELAVPVAPVKRGEFLAKLTEHFLVKPFDIHAAAIAADLFQRSRQGSPESSRAVLSADIKLVATAKAAHVKISYPHDMKCRQLADLAKLRHTTCQHTQSLFLIIKCGV